MDTIPPRASPCPCPCPCHYLCLRLRYCISFFGFVFAFPIIERKGLIDGWIGEFIDSLLYGTWIQDIQDPGMQCMLGFKFGQFAGTVYFLFSQGLHLIFGICRLILLNLFSLDTTMRTYHSNWMNEAMNSAILFNSIHPLYCTVG